MKKGGVGLAAEKAGGVSCQTKESFFGRPKSDMATTRPGGPGHFAISAFSFRDPVSNVKARKCPVEGLVLPAAAVFASSWTLVDRVGGNWPDRDNRFHFIYPEKRQ
jgi:hypothetical protein